MKAVMLPRNPMLMVIINEHLDEDAADEEVLVNVMMEKMICWKMPHPNMMTLRPVIFRNDLACPAVPQEFYLLVNFRPIGP